MDTGMSPSAKPCARLKWSNAIGYIVLIAFNVASQTGLLGDDNATISAKYPTLLTPAGCAAPDCTCFTFTI